jgi:hypothetical protein
MLKPKVLVVIALLVVIVIFSTAVNHPKTVIRETVCIPDGKKERLVLNLAVMHDGKFFPLYGEKRDGCLLLHDIDTWDADDDGILEPFKWGQFVDPAYNHCCTGGG